MSRKIAIIGGGVAGVTAAWQLAKLAGVGAAVRATLFEATPRLGGIVETFRPTGASSHGFIVECGPDGWVTEKPWARELAEELGLAHEIISSNDATRKTYVLQKGSLVPIPDDMRMMVPRGLAALDAIDASPLFTPGAKAAFRAEVGRAEELKAAAPDADESVASFVERHFGLEVLEKIGAPLLGGVFGGDVTTLSVRAVMAPFVALERQHGSLILGLEEAGRSSPEAARRPIFTSLRGGTGRLIERMVEEIPPHWVRLKSTVLGIAKTSAGWSVETAAGVEEFADVLVATPVDVVQRLLRPVDPQAADLMTMEATSAVVAAFAFRKTLALPPGFGFLVPPGSSENKLLAATFVDQKYPRRVPEGGRLLRGFFGGATAETLLSAKDEAIAGLALEELQKTLGRLPVPQITIVRRWPRSLPQYAVGHLERMSELFARVDALPGLRLLGNGYRGVGLPDLIRDARAAAREICAS